MLSKHAHRMNMVVTTLTQVSLTLFAVVQRFINIASLTCFQIFISITTVLTALYLLYYWEESLNHIVFLAVNEVYILKSLLALDAVLLFLKAISTHKRETAIENQEILTCFLRGLLSLNLLRTWLGDRSGDNLTDGARDI